MIFTFYSYKGGVGRTMALANVAELLCREGLKVIIIDWDLESPDLEHYFLADTGEAGSRRGLVDLILDFKEVMTQPPPGPTEKDGQPGKDRPVGKEALPLPEIKDYCVEVYPDGEQSLSLLPAGKRVGSHFEQYAEMVRRFDWKDFYDNWEGKLFFKWLRQGLTDLAEVVLINSCTGINEMGSVCTQQMASVVVLFCSSNQQGLINTLNVAAALTGAQSPAARSGEGVPVIIVPARIEDRAEAQLVNGFKEHFLDGCKRYLPEYENGKRENEDYFWNLRVPNVPRFTFKEELVMRSQRAEGEDDKADIVTAFTRIAQAMARFAPKGSPLRRICGDQPVPIVRPLAGVEPYRGLSPFLEEHARLFFGRKAYVEKLLDYVRQGGMVAVIGQSGSGKSSLVQAGLLPELRKGELLPGSENWEILMFKPGVSPFAALAAALAPLLREAGEGSFVDDGRLVAALREETDSLGRVVSKVLAGQSVNARLLLIIDQFEELYTIARDDPAAFLKQLVSGVESSPLTVVFTLRADFYETSKQYIDVARWHEVKLGQMSREELKDAVIRPAGLMGVTFEAGLVDRILADVGEEPGNLPLLQFALTMLWQNRNVSRLTHEAYAMIGGVQQAVALRADDVYENLSRADQEIARRIFTQLVQLIEGGSMARRPATFAELGEQFDKKVREIIKALTDARLLVVAKETALSSETPEEQIDIAHEALIQNWKRLQAWLKADREFLLWRQHLRSDVTRWKGKKKDRSALLRGPSLQEALKWQNERADHLSEDEKAFITNSLHRQTWRRGTKIAAVALMAVAVVAYSLLVWKTTRAKQELITASVYYLRGSSLEQQGDYPAALSNFTQAIKLNPEFPDTYLSRANLYSKIGGQENYQHAIEDYTKFITFNTPDSAAAYTGRGVVYRKLGDSNSALNDFNKALDINQSFDQALYNRASQFAEAGQLDNAIDNYTQAIALNPNFYQAYTDRGKVFYRRGKETGSPDDLQRASADFTKASELNSSSAEPDFYLGLLHAERSEYTKAIELYTKAIELKADYAEAYNARGQAYDRLGQADNAIPDYRKAVDLNYLPAYNNLGIAYENNGEFESAIIAFDRIIKDDSNNAEAYWHRGEAYAQRGVHDKAIEDYNKSIELKPDQIDIYFSRGVSYASINQEDRAIEDFQKFIKSPKVSIPRLYEARQYLEKLNFRPPRSDLQIYLHYNEEIDAGLLEQINSALKANGFGKIRLIPTTENTASVKYFQKPFKDYAILIRDIIKRVFESKNRSQRFKVEKFPSPIRRDTYGWIEIWVPSPPPTEPAVTPP